MSSMKSKSFLAQKFIHSLVKSFDLENLHLDLGNSSSSLVVGWLVWFFGA